MLVNLKYFQDIGFFNKLKQVIIFLNYFQNIVKLQNKVK